MQEQVDVLDVGLDERLLDLEVEVVDECLHLLPHPRSDPAAAGCERQMRTGDQPLELGDEPLRHGHDRGHPPGRKLLVGLLLRHPDDLDVLRDVVDQVVDVERLSGNREPVRDSVEVDEGHARLRVRVGRGQPDQ